MSRELRPAKRLINGNFEGYKLDPNGLKQISKPLVAKVHQVKRDPNKFTYNYIKQQLMHNNLFYNQWDDSVYFVDESYNITLVKNENNDFSCYNVFTFEKENEKVTGKFSPSLSFPTDSVCIATSGTGLLHFINTQNSFKPKEWSSLATGPMHDFDTPVSILNSYLDQSTNLIHLLVLSLKDFQEEGKTPVTHALVHWLQISHNRTDMVECSIRKWKTFKGRNLPRDCWLSDDYTELFVVSENEFELVNVITYERIQTKNTSEEDEIKYYHWHQGKELLTIVFDISTTQDEVECNICYNNISIKLKSGQVLLEGTLEKLILEDASKWYIQNGKLEIVLVKKAVGEFWTNVIPNEKHGVHDIDGEELERINQIHEQLEHLTSDGITREESQTKQFNIQQLEECDENLNEDIKVYSIDVLSGKVKLETTLGGQMLFSTLTRKDGVPHICLRYDVDGIVWQPSRERTAFWVHVFTLDGFGYVLASKPEHKYVGCGPNFEYAVITDCKSNLYVYECREGAAKTRTQFVASFNDCEEILGCVVGKSMIYVLTDTHIVVLELPKKEIIDK